MRRLVIFIVIFALFLAFIVFNIGNKCDVSFGFRVFKDVPVFVSAFISFAAGMLFAAPLILSARRKRKDSAFTPQGSKGKTSRGKGRKNYQGDTYSDGGGLPGVDKNSKETSLYGID